MANYHPKEELLMSFAAGQLSDSLGLMIACHLESCDDCCEKVKQFEALGGNILEASEEVEISEDLLDRTLALLDVEPLNDINKESNPRPGDDTRIPRPLRRFVTKSFDELDWSGFSKNIREITLDLDDAFTTKLYRIRAGQNLPEHTHEGTEFTLVLQGSFSDRTCDYNEGDFILADSSTTHQPKASNSEDCICLAVMDAPLKLTGLFGRMLNPFIK